MTEVKLVGDGTQIQITGHSFANENENKTITLQKQDKVEMAQTEIELRRVCLTFKRFFFLFVFDIAFKQ